jgi:hypothetical protein
MIVSHQGIAPVSKVEGPGEGEQFYVTHCAAPDSVLNNPGYSVRAASVTDTAVLNSALRYPPYELPMALWQRLPPASAAPRRLARTKSARGVWVVHSAYLPRDTVGRDRSYFTHLMRVPAADAATVLRSWAADEWTIDYPPSAPKVLPGTVRVPVGTLVSDSALTAFLGATPPGTTELSVTVCPWRLRGSVEMRREQFARFALAAFLLTLNDSRRLFVHAEPGALALLLYGAIRLLPQSFGTDLTFSTFEPAHLNLRDYKLARVVGTYLGTPDQGLAPEFSTVPDLVLDTFDPARSSPELRVPLRQALGGLNDLIPLAVSGNWALVNAIQAAPGAPSAIRAWLAEAGAYARGEKKLPVQQEALSLDEPETEALSLDDDVNVTLVTPSTPSKQKAPVLPPAKPVGGMTYSAQISRTNPACFLFLIDQSKSMADPFIAGTAQTKAGVVADALNRLIQNVVLRSAKADGVRDYFRVGVIGYGAGIKAGLGGSVPFNVLIPVSQLGANPLRVETRTKLIPDGVGGTVEQKVKFPVWFEAEASGQTPMCEAFAAAGLVVKGFIEQFPNAYPPIVLNLSDGMPSDGNPQLNARLLTNQGTSDGAVLLFNLLISSKPVPTDYFPATEERLPDVCSKLLFRMSSVLPPKLWEAAKSEGHDLRPRARGAVVNADPTAIVRFLDIGTRVTPSGK